MPMTTTRIQGAGLVAVTALVAVAACAVIAVGCRPRDVLSVPAPAGVTASSTLQSQAGAESAFNTARFQTFNGLVGSFTNGLLLWTEVLTDEFTWSSFSGDAFVVNIDARMTAPGNGNDAVDDGAWQNVLTGRSSLVLALPLVQRYEPAAGQSKIGEAYALMGYAELVMAEGYCAGTTLSDVGPGGQPQYGMPLTTDSLLGVAEAHFDSALAHANGDATVQNLAQVGLGRTLVNRGRLDSAAMAVASVPTGFVYNTDLPLAFGQGGVQTANVYAEMYAGGPSAHGTFITVASREGGTGLNFVTAQDPRVVVDSTLRQTDDGGTWYFPAKFEGAGLELIPLATGVEARLIQAEAALKATDVNGWATDLNALRADAADTKVVFPLATQSLTADSTTLASAAMQVDVMFRERAFWLFGTGTRLGDLRRLIRQYGRDQSTVFPTGPYPNGSNPNLPSPIPAYGTDVTLTPPTGVGGVTVSNPNYKGCVTSSKTA
jgi:hypothetical protein